MITPEKKEMFEKKLTPLRKKIEERQVIFSSFHDDHFAIYLAGEKFDYDIAKAKLESTAGFKSLFDICIRNRILCRIISRSRSPVYRILAAIMNRILEKKGRALNQEIMTFLTIVHYPELFFTGDESEELIDDIIGDCNGVFMETENQLESIHGSN